MEWYWIVTLIYVVIETLIVIVPKRANPVSRFLRDRVQAVFINQGIENMLLLCITSPFWAPDGLIHTSYYISDTLRVMCLEWAEQAAGPILKKGKR